MHDVLIVGACQAGSSAVAGYARGGARLRIVDRAAFPRDKLCGDTVNPGTLARLRALGIVEPIERCGLRVGGMLVTGERGVAIEGRYPRGLSGRAIVRRDFDWALLQSAMAAGCQFESGVHVQRADVADARVGGVIVGNNGHERVLDAPITIAADGRHSTIAFGLGLARHPVRPRRWAIGAYFTGVRHVSDRGRTGVEALERGWSGVHARLAARRRREFSGKQRFNRALRALVASPRAVSAAAIGARLAPAILEAVILRAGDCDAVPLA